MKTLNRILAMILAVIMIGSSVPVYADTGSSGNSNPTGETYLNIISDITATGPSGGITRDQQSLDFHIEYTLKPESAGTPDAPGVARQRAVWVYDLSNFLNSYPELTGFGGSNTGDIYDGTQVAGSYEIRDNQVRITPDPNWLSSKRSKDNIKGTFSLRFNFDGTKLPEDGNRTYQFPGATSSTTVKFPETKVTASKSVDNENNGVVTATKQADGTYLLHYTLKVNSDTDLNTLSLTDTLSGTQTFKTDSFKLSVWNNNTQSIPVSWLNISGRTLTFNLGNYLKSKGNSVQGKTEYEIAYDTVVQAADIGTRQSNTANWAYDGGKSTPGGSKNVITNKRLNVTKSVQETGGNTYTYTVTVGDGSESLAGHTIKDIMSDNQVLQGSINITPALPDGSTTLAPSAAAMDSSHSDNDVNLFEYTIPADSNAETQYTITYTTVAAVDSSLTGTHAIRNRTEDTHGHDYGQSDTTTKNHDFGIDHSNAQIDKQFDGWDVARNQAKWLITLTIPQDTPLPLNNVEVRETAFHYGYGNDQWNGGSLSFDWNNATVSAAQGTLNKGSDYTIDTNLNRIHFNQITDAMGRTITIHLNTTLQNGLTSANGGAYIYNQAQVYVNDQPKDEGHDEGKYSSGT